MTSRTVDVLIDYFKEDLEAWVGADFLGFSTPRRVGWGFVVYLKEEAERMADDIEMRKDPMGLLGLLSGFLEEENFSDDDLTTLGHAILDRAI